MSDFDYSIVGQQSQVGALIGHGTRVTVDAAKAIMSERFGLECEVTSLAGEKDSNFAATTDSGQRLFLKVAGTDEEVDFFSMHTAAIRFVTTAAPNLPVHKLVQSLDGADQFSVIDIEGNVRVGRVVEFMPGRLQSQGGINDLQRFNVGVAAARLQAALEGFSHSADDRTLVWDLAHAEHLAPLLQDVPDNEARALIQSVLDRFVDTVVPKLRTTRRLVAHNDLSSDNVLIDPDSDKVTGIIDFGDMVRTFEAADIAVGAAYQMPGGHDPLQGALHFLQGYASARSIDPVQVELLYDLILTRTAMRVLLPLARATRFPENAAYLLRNVGLSRSQLDNLAKADRSRANARVSEACTTETN